MAAATPWAEAEARIAAAELFWISTVRPDLWDQGDDLVVEGAAVRVADDAELRVLAAAWEEKYGSFWHYEVRDGCFHHGAGHAYVFAVRPRTVFGFGKGAPFSQTRWRFGR